MKVFLSYRRDDTGGRAGRLFDVLVTRFGVRNVFQDVSTIGPGIDFTAQVEAAIETSDVVLVMIGPSWLGDSDGGGRRIDRPDDFVRQEVSRALASGLPVVPVLVEGASLPPPDQLPEDLTSLVLRQAVTLRDVSWHSDVDDLIRRLGGDQRLATRRPRRWRIIAGAGLSAVVAVAVVVAVLISRGDDGGSSDDSGDGSVAPTSPISLPAVEFAPTSQGARTCAGGGRIELSAGPVTLVGDIMTAAFVATARGLETETHFGSIRVVDDHGRPYDEVDAGELNGGFTLEQEGFGGVTERTTELSMNRDLRAHPDAAGIVLIVTGECTDDPILLPVTLPSG